MGKIDNSPYTIESPIGYIFQYSPDIEWDWDSGEYPKGTEPVFNWSNEYRPVTYEDGKWIPYHVWSRFKLRRLGTWSTPSRVKGDKGDKGDTGVVKAVYPIVLKDGVLLHAKDEGVSHIPAGGNEGQFLKKGVFNRYEWGDVNVDIDLSAYYTKVELQTGGESIVNWSNISDKPTYDLDSLSDVTLTTPTENDIMQYIGGKWVNTQFDISSLNWTVHFPTTYLPIAIAKDVAVTLDSVVLENITSILISLNGGAYGAFIPGTTIGANEIFRIQVVSFIDPSTDGVLLIKGTKI